jgi:hypothetical protein
MQYLNLPEIILGLELVMYYKVLLMENQYELKKFSWDDHFLPCTYQALRTHSLMHMDLVVIICHENFVYCLSKYMCANMHM